LLRDALPHQPPELLELLGIFALQKFREGLLVLAKLADTIA